MELNAIFNSKANLYELLNLQVRNTEDLSRLSPFQFRRSFRQQALKFHPDKNPDNAAAVSRFHDLNVALNILCDPVQREKYNSWFIQTFLKQEAAEKVRQEHRQKLSSRENAEKNKHSIRQYDLTKYEEYGHFLRKVKYFKVPYGDWKNYDLNPSSPTHPLKESCTIRLEVTNIKLLRSKDALRDLLGECFQVELFDLYYSSRNDYENDHSLVAYATLMNIETTLRILREWKAKSFSHGQNAIQSYIEDISPKTDPAIFKFYE